MTTAENRTGNNRPRVVRLAVSQFNDGRYFECHETLEDAWRMETDVHWRNFLQGFIHLAVALHHARRNNSVGFQLQLQKHIRRWKVVRLEEISLRFGFYFEIVKGSGSGGMRDRPKIRSIGSVKSR